MAMSRKDLEELRPWIDKRIQKFLGFSEPSVVTTAVNCFSNGYDKTKTTEKLGTLLDDRKARKLADELFGALGELKHKSKAKKRHKDDDDGFETKKSKKSEEEIPNIFLTQPQSQLTPSQLSAMQIKEMMAKAHMMIEEKKKALNLVQVDPSHPMISNITTNSSDNAQKQMKLSELQAQIQARLTSKPGLLDALQQKAIPINRPAPLILDDEGRTIDVSGREIQLTQRQPTLKANIRAKRREEFKLNQGKPDEEISESTFYDSRVTIKVAQRSKRGFRFHDKGKYEQLAQRLRTKAQLERLQTEISLAAKKTGIVSATKLAQLQPKNEFKEGEIPEIEWWDSVIVKSDSYEGIKPGSERFEGVTSLVEHPLQMKPPVDTFRPEHLPVFLTKKEKKKLRRMNRREAWKEKQEKIRLGLEPPPEPKVRMANLMRVLGTEAVQDPTKVEAHVRAQMAKRQKAHEEANAARKLTTEQRRDKKIKKLKEDTDNEVHVVVYRLKDLSNQAKKFKVETNANQLFLTGLVVLHRECNVVVVEGGPKQQKRYKRLMLHRIKWQEDMVYKDPKRKEGEKTENKCSLVWEGTVKNRSFGEMRFKVCPTENFAREHFKKNGAEHYWDLAYSASVLEAAEDT